MTSYVLTCRKNPNKLKIFTSTTTNTNVSSLVGFNADLIIFVLVLSRDQFTKTAFNDSKAVMKFLRKWMATFCVAFKRRHIGVSFVVVGVP
jgi:hypothetical protein